MQAHMELRAERERPVVVTGADGVRRKRASARMLMTLAGEVRVDRLAYQARDVDGLHPMDAALNLPQDSIDNANPGRLAARSAFAEGGDNCRSALPIRLRRAGLTKMFARSGAARHTFLATASERSSIPR